MPHIDDEAKTWQMELAKNFGDAVAARRETLKLSAAALSERTRALGYPISRGAIAKIEANARSGKVDVAELIVLSRALESVPPLMIYPNLPHGKIRPYPSAKPLFEHISALYFTADTPGRLVHPDVLKQISPSNYIPTRAIELTREFVNGTRWLMGAYRDRRRAAESNDRDGIAAADVDAQRHEERMIKTIASMEAEGMTVQDDWLTKFRGDLSGA